MLRALLRGLKDEPGGAELLAGATIPCFTESRSQTSWRFARSPLTSLALDGALLSQVRTCLGQH